MSREKKRDVGTSLGSLLKAAQLEEAAAAERASKKGEASKRKSTSKKGASRKAGSAKKKPGPSKARAGSKKGRAKIVRRPSKPQPVEPRLSEGLVGPDRTAYMDAMGGVRRLESKGPDPKMNPSGQRPPSAVAMAQTSDAEVRARLAALVGGGVRFEIEHDDERIRAWRVGTAPRVAAELERRGVAPEATIDLHGMTAAVAESALVRFVRTQHRRGVRRLCVVHGKGLHSAGGIGVLGDHTRHVLTDGGAAPLVLAFATASSSLGGSGALIVQLIR